MTSRVQAKVTYNYPIVIEKSQEGYPTERIFKSEGEPETYIGEQVYELDSYFSDKQVITITEQRKESTA